MSQNPSSPESAMTTKPGKPVGASDFVTEAYNVHGKQGLKKFYEKWAEDYDRQMLGKLDYVSPRIIAEMMRCHLPGKEARILDIGCGTGLTAQALHGHGYTSLHGIDLSEDMVRVAGKRGIYKELTTTDVTRPLPFEDNGFDGAISSGTFTHGHVDAGCLEEIFRVIKPGGLLACTVNFDIWESAGFAETFAGMEEDRRIRCLARTADKFYDGKDPAGWFCVYRRLAE